MAESGRQADLFGGVPPRLPEGFTYSPEFITSQEEAALLAAIAELPLEEARYKDYTARRRTVHYGSEYDFDRNALEPAPALPDFLLPLREKAARWVGIEPEAFAHGLVSEYRPGTPLGWHRDVPNFELIFGVSLGGSCRMRLRPYRPGEKSRREDVIALTLEPRSAYSIQAAARWGWQHSISATKELRYSITFRTARATRAAGA
ncbi:MAG: alpha-ketoglutarate-dependent dioxygenase AlkB [Burkholderiales bacterium]